MTRLTADTPSRKTVPPGSGDEHRNEFALVGAELREQFPNPTSEYGIFTLDPEGRVASWSAAAEGVTGRPVGDAIGRHFSVFYCQEDRDARVPELALEAAGRNGKYEARMLLVRGDDRGFTAGVGIQLLWDAWGRSVGFVIMVRDLGEQWHQQQIVEQKRAERAQAEHTQALMPLSRGLAHEFNNILQTMQGAVEVLRRRVQSVDPGSSGVIDMMKRAVDHGTRITQRLLAFSRRPPLELQLIRPDEFLAGMAHLLRQSLPDTVALETIPTAGESWICTDIHQLETAILNLATNARNAMPQGGRLMIETGNVFLEKARSTVNQDVPPGPYVMIAVRDTGVGMSKEMIAKTFEPFFTPELGYGTGRGLSQVYEFIRQSTGHVELLSEPGKGTVAKLYFAKVDAATASIGSRSAGPGEVSATDVPDADRPPPKTSNVTKSANAVSGTKSLAGLRVLVIEDESLVGMLIEDMLDQLGCAVAGSVSSLQQALENAARLEIDFAVLDVNLRGQPSYPVAEALQARGVPFVFISGYGDVSERWRSRPILQKPFELDQLRREMGRALQGD